MSRIVSIVFMTLMTSFGVFSAVAQTDEAPADASQGEAPADASGNAEAGSTDSESATPEIITVSRVRLVIDGAEYSWEEGSPPEKTEGHTAPALALSFLDFGPGSRMSPSELETRCAAARDRLLDSGCFFDARVSVVPPRLYPERRTVLVELREGFTWRFAGGSAFGMVGQDNAFGSGESWRFVLGWNLDALYWGEKLAFGLPIEYSVEARFAHSLGDAFVESMDFAVDARLGWRFHPDAAIALLAGGRYSDYSGGSFLPAIPATDAIDAAPWALLGLELSWRSHRRLDDGAETDARFLSSVFGATLPDGFMLVADAKASLSFAFGFLRVGILGAAGWRGGTDGAADAPWPLLRDLWGAPDFSVRSGWDRESLYADEYALATAELAARLPVIPLGGVFTLSVAPFLFADLAWASRCGSGGFFDAYGIGVRLGFDNPVFAYFTFAFGWNRDGSGRFTMTGGAGF